MRALKIWHREKHDDYTITELIIKEYTRSRNSDGMFPADSDPYRWVAKIKEERGFWNNDVFIPWHSISYIEITDMKR